MRVLPLKSMGIVLLAFGLAGAAWAATDDDMLVVQSLMQEGKSEQAAALLDVRLAKDPGNFELRYLKALNLLDQEKFTEAVSVLDNLLKAYPHVAELLNNRAYALTHLKQYSRAIQDFEEAIRLNPNYALSHENLGVLYAILAETALTQAQKLDRGNPRLAARIAQLQGVEGAAGGEAKAAKSNKSAPAPSAAVVAPIASVSTQSLPGEAGSVPAPAASAPAVAPVAKTASTVSDVPAAQNAPVSDTEVAVGLAVEAWRAAWAGKDMKTYFAAYVPGFKTANMKSPAEWRTDREKKIGGRPESITVDMVGMGIAMRDDGAADVRYDQTFRAGNVEMKDRKNLVLRNVDGRWLIEIERTLIK